MFYGTDISAKTLGCDVMMHADQNDGEIRWSKVKGVCYPGWREGGGEGENASKLKCT